MGIAALVLSIVGVVLCWIPFVGWVGVVLALVGLILGIVTLKKGKKGLGIASLVLGVVGLGLGLYIQIASILAAQAIATGLEQGMQGMQGLNDPAAQQKLQDALNQAMQQAQQAAPPAAPAAPPAQ
jgi:hypothetical protein